MMLIAKDDWFTAGALATCDLRNSGVTVIFGCYLIIGKGGVLKRILLGRVLVNDILKVLLRVK